jgi:hypothetical protein
MNTKQIIGSVVLFIVLYLVFPAVIAFIITGIWVAWVLFANADGLSKEDVKYDSDEAILSIKDHKNTRSDEKDLHKPKRYSALEKRKALLSGDIK